MCIRYSSFLDCKMHSQKSLGGFVSLLYQKIRYKTFFLGYQFDYQQFILNSLWQLPEKKICIPVQGHRIFFSVKSGTISYILFPDNVNEESGGKSGIRISVLVGLEDMKPFGKLAYHRIITERANQVVMLCKLVMSSQHTFIPVGEDVILSLAAWMLTSFYDVSILSQVSYIGNTVS